jgi:uncharacterized protein YkwD
VVLVLAAALTVAPRPAAAGSSPEGVPPTIAPGTAPGGVSPTIAPGSPPGGVSPTIAPPPPPEGVSPTIAADFVWAIEVERTTRGLPGLVPDMALAATAQLWSGGMALFDTLVEDRQYATTIATSDPAWRAAAENVGEGSSTQAIEAAFMASPPHRANILGDYTHVGVGVFVDGAGRIWVTERFYC